MAQVFKLIVVHLAHVSILTFKEYPILPLRGMHLFPVQALLAATLAGRRCPRCELAMMMMIILTKYRSVYIIVGYFSHTLPPKSNTQLAQKEWPKGYQTATR
jgi:hypothetical protein